MSFAHREDRELAKPARAVDAGAMRLGDYLRGHRLVMQTPLARGEVERRINETAASIFWLFEEGVAGWARFSRLRLKVRHPWSATRGPLTLSGRIVEAHAGSRLLLNYRFAISIYLFLAVWYFTLVASLIGLLAEASITAKGSELAIAAVMTIIFLGAPVGALMIATSSADSDLRELIEFLEREAQAKPVASGMQR